MQSVMTTVLNGNRQRRFYGTILGSGPGLWQAFPRLKAAALLLLDRRFILCGVSLILGLHHVKAVEKAGILLDSGGRVSLPRAAYSNVKKAWINYWLGG